ncbi:helix-turn-helix transcriptional regulator [Tepidiforma sp.]|uniref:helix-turn-helix transcriptional regulator n=1 Tax=Tepidiforma sp. TaxID=2682230 RepID=UPI002ADD6444|nr:LuxR C-terminal-related transcriptional regulator [Tepidiforma sp.]
MPAAWLLEAREAYDRRARRASRDAYRAHGFTASLAFDDFERLAAANHLLGDEQESREALVRGYRRAIELEDLRRAVRFAFFLGHGMMFTGEFAQANGWFGRARGLLTDCGTDCVEWGYLLIPEGVEALGSGDAGAACEAFTAAAAYGRRYADSSLLAAAGHGRGRALLRLGHLDEGMAALDEAMVAVGAGEVSPLLVGHIFCGVLEACQEVLDVRRAQEWTAVFSRWCEGQEDLVPYRAPCLVHRIEVMRWRGDWADALEEARQACDWLSLPSSPQGHGDAFYHLGELYRLRGEGSAAQAAYRQASRRGRSPQPGLALLWAGSDQFEAAERALHYALGETEPDRPMGDWERLIRLARRAELQSAYVDVLLRMGDVVGARSVVSELAEVAAAVDSLPVRALRDRAAGSVALAEGRPQESLAPLRRSWAAWQQLEAPYEGARVRVLIGRAYRALGDDQSAAMEFDAARWVFERLGAAPDLKALRADAGEAWEEGRGMLTPREVDVLRLIASGETNKEVAATLVISEHTVARHVQNMMAKLGVGSRAGLAAYAVRSGLAMPGHGEKSPHRPGQVG